MVTIEELISGQVDGQSSASITFNDDTLDVVRQAPEGLTAYDILLATLDED
ncbi:hypothetical protein ACVRYP_03010 [Streptococcus rifensis]